MSSADRSTRVLRTRPSSGNIVDASDDSDSHSDSSPSPVPRKKMRVSRSQDVELVSKTPGYMFYDDLVSRLYAKPEGSGFRKPVLDLWTEDAVPGYLDSINEPMDLGTIKDRLKGGHYIRYHPGNPYLEEEAIKRDICLVFENCMEYNEEDSEYYQFAHVLLEVARKGFIVRDAALKLEQQADREKKAQKDHEESEARKAQKREKDRIRHAKRYAAKKPERDALRREKEKQKALDAEEKARQRDYERARAINNRATREATLTELNQAKARGLLPNLTLEHRKRPRGEDGLAKILQKKRRTAPANRSTSSISSAEADELWEEMELVGGETVRDLNITFVSTAGLEKKRGRKSVTVQALEAQHEELMKQRRLILDTKLKFEEVRYLEMPTDEMKRLCEQVQVLDFVQMKKVLEILAKHLQQPAMLQENEIDLDLMTLDNEVRREIQIFLENPVVATLQGELPDIEKKLTDIEAHYIGIRYQNGGAPPPRRS